jgi:hypothetical protein
MQLIEELKRQLSNNFIIHIYIVFKQSLLHQMCYNKIYMGAWWKIRLFYVLFEIRTKTWHIYIIVDICILFLSLKPFFHRRCIFGFRFFNMRIQLKNLFTICFIISNCVTLY